MSLALAGLVLGLALLCAWAVWHFGRKHGESETKLRVLVVLFVVGGLVGSWYAYRVDAELRRTTLFEVVLEGVEGAETEGDTAVHRLSFEVEHAGVEHDLLVAPKPGPGREAAGPVTLRVRLRAPDGAWLVDETRTFETYAEGTGARGPPVRRILWRAETWRPTPTALGPHLLELWHVTPGIPTIHVRVADPRKTDGTRAPGY